VKYNIKITALNVNANVNMHRIQ